MGSFQRFGEPSLSDSGPSQNHHNIRYAIPLQTNTSFLKNHQAPSFDFGELEEAISLQGVKIINDDDTTKQQPLYTTTRPAATLEMFPSGPMRFQQNTSRGSSKSGEESTDSGSGTRLVEPESPVSGVPPDLQQVTAEQKMHYSQPPQMDAASGGGDSLRSGGSDDKSNPEKTMRRLAQNREAARKSRLRKKAYVQQLESSRIRLTQLEQELQRSRSQGLFLGGGGVAAGGNVSSGGVMFDMEYARWLDDDHRHVSELRTALQANLSDSNLRVILDGYISHYDDIFRLKGVAAKSDVFHLITGMWKTPAERCFLWMGGFRPSDIIKMLMVQLDPLTEQQVVGIYGLQQSSQQAEEALSQGLEQLQHSLIDTIASGSVNDTMHHMAVALGKLANLEGFVRQADNLRQQTLHQLQRILIVRQAARCFLVIGEYNGRLRALSSLWASRPRGTSAQEHNNSYQMTTDLQMMQCSQSHFTDI